MKPQEVLDLNLDTVMSYIQGYEDRLLDYQILAVQSGYYAAYYSGTKHPKSPKVVAEEIIRSSKKSDAAKSNTTKPDIDVEAFLAQEAKFKERMSKA